MLQQINSQLDASVNFVEQQLTGFIESRYVRRQADYFIAYLSSQTGCNRGCQMCHLTATKQTQFLNLDQSNFVSQFETVLSHYEKDTPAQTVHLNFMARGEPLANTTITKTGTELFWRLGNMARDRGLRVKFNVSTIMPVTLKKSLCEVFPLIPANVYYSIYSINSSFRNKWLPAAMPVERALANLKEYQQVSKKIIKFHGAFIKGENDSEQDVEELMNTIAEYSFHSEFNIVRYNPYSSQQGEESLRVDDIAAQIQQYMPCKIIPKVGQDVYASCGQFVPK
jgi:adenine C2-methylase RlmN of 23S rRNA A2503 and tRNA A37